MGDLLNWAKREVEIACKKKIQIEKKENLITVVRVMRAH